MTGYGSLNMDAETHSKLHREVKKVLDEGDWKSTPEIEKAVEMKEWTDQHIRSMLTYLRQYMVEQNEIEVERRRQGGQPTCYWRLKNS